MPRGTKTASKDVAKLLDFKPVPPQDQRQVSSVEAPILGRSNDLSVIAEGDESPERSHPPTTVSSAHATQSGVITEIHFQTDVRDNGQEEPVPEMANLMSPSSANTFHSIALESPDQTHSLHPRSGYSEHSTPHLAPSSPATLPNDPFTLSSMPPVSESNPLLDTVVVPLNDSEPQSNPLKDNVPHFPTLPAPSPLRKSMRLPPETTNNVLPSTTPAPPPLGKRTSWLMKAREAKAMEGGATRPSAFNSVPLRDSCNPDSVPIPTSMKRKSSEMLGNLPHKTGEKKPKLLKTAESDTVPLINVEMERDQERTSDGSIPLPAIASASKPFDNHDIANRHSVVLDDTEEGFIGQFKRTVEGLGSRTCKGTTKPLGGAAAALAEARAAAEARVAERNRANDEVHSPDNATEPPLMQPPRPLQEELNIIGGKQRLHVSDQAKDTQESNEKIVEEIFQIPSVHGSPAEGEQRLSTTPANSPPHKDAGFVKPAGPVFTKQPIATTLAHTKSSAPATHPKEFSFNIPTNTFTLPAPILFDASTRLMSLKSNIRGGLENGERESEAVAASHVADTVEPDELEIHEQDSVDSFDIEDSRMDTAELGVPSTTTSVEVMSRSLTKYVLTSF